MLKTLEPQPLATGVAYKKSFTAVTAEEIIHFFVRTNSVSTNRQTLVKNKSKLRKLSGLEVSTQKITLTIIHIPFENMLTKR